MAGKEVNFKEWLDSLQADILCFQELKIQRKDLSEDFRDVLGYRAFFTLPVNKSAYSGVAVYLKDDITPVKVETTLLSSSFGERANKGSRFIGGYPDHPDRLILDSEGRCLVIDLNTFVLISVYCPAVRDGDSERDRFRLEFLRVLMERVTNLIAFGREVVLVGDLNVILEEIDTVPENVSCCDPNTNEALKLIRQYVSSRASNDEDTSKILLVDVIRMANKDVNLCIVPLLLIF